jgi:hypothetical protein
MATRLHPLARLLGLALALLAALGLSGCPPVDPGSGIRLNQVVQERPGQDPRWVQSEPRAAGVRVFRGGAEINASLHMQLQPGDEVQTGPLAGAVLAFRDRGEIVLDENTRVRVGSLEVFFGRVFASLRGLFETTSEEVAATNEGTRYVFEVARDGSTKVAVLDGVVNCRSRQGSWAPARLRAQETLTTVPGRRAPPRLGLAAPHELRDADEWARRVSAAPHEGWCCAQGQVDRTWSNRCVGRFSSLRSQAEAWCKPAAPPPDPDGWCCVRSQTVPARRSQCAAGSWHDSQAEAARACRTPAPATPVLR